MTFSSLQIFLRRIPSGSFVLPTTAFGTTVLYHQIYYDDKADKCLCEASFEKGYSWEKRKQKNVTIPAKLKTRVSYLLVQETLIFVHPFAIHTDLFLLL